MTQGRESFKELNSSIESFERAVRARPRVKEREPGRPPQRLDRKLRRHTFLRTAVIAGLTLLAALFYFGRGERVPPQPPSHDRAGPAAFDPTGAKSAETGGEREAAAVDVTPASTEPDHPIEPVASRLVSQSDTTDPDSIVATGTDAVVEDAGIDVTVHGSNRSVERDERTVETGTAALVPQEGDYATQVAAYDQRGLARVLVDRLVAAGYPAYVVEARLEADQVVFRVRIGPYPDLSAARAVGQRVQDEEGLDWYVVTGR